MYHLIQCSSYLCKYCISHLLCVSQQNDQLATTVIVLGIVILGLFLQKPFK